VKTQIHTKQIYFKERETHLNYTWLHFASAAAQILGITHDAMYMLG